MYFTCKEFFSYFTWPLPVTLAYISIDPFFSMSFDGFDDFDGFDIFDGFDTADDFESIEGIDTFESIDIIENIESYRIHRKKGIDG